MSIVLRLRNPVLYALTEVFNGIEPQMPIAMTCSFRHTLLTSLPSLDTFLTPLPELPETTSHKTTFTRILASRSASWGTQPKIIHYYSHEDNLGKVLKSWVPISVIYTLTAHIQSQGYPH